MLFKFHVRLWLFLKIISLKSAAFQWGQLKEAKWKELNVLGTSKQNMKMH